ncbi:MAG: hypothetical protein AMXMBFR34_13430 [Myxococcaceae bacterium]
MKRVVLAALVVLLLGVAGLLVFKRPPRARPPGYDAPWASLPESPEQEWGVDPVKRSVVQEVFTVANEDLEHCNIEHYGGAQDDLVVFDLLFEQQPGGMQLVFAREVPRNDLPALLLPCFAQALERTPPVKRSGLEPGARWRVTVHLTVHAAGDLPPPPWWHRFVPDSWKSGGGSAIHIG